MIENDNRKFAGLTEELGLDNGMGNTNLSSDILIMEGYKKNEKLKEDDNLKKANLEKFEKGVEMGEIIPKYYPEFNEENTISLEHQEGINRFLNDNSAVLTIYSPSYLFRDIAVLQASISRDINSIGAIVEKYVSLPRKVVVHAIIEAQKQNYIFGDDTPDFLLSIPVLIKQSIEIDIKTIDYVLESALTDDLKELALKLAKEKGYVISDTGHNFLKKDIDIVKSSLTVNPQLADCIDFNNFTPEQQEELIQIIINSGKNYILNDGSPKILKSNANICIKSIDADLSSVRYIDAQKLSGDEEEKIIDKLIEKQYVIDETTPDFIKLSSKLCISSVKLDINSLEYFNEMVKRWLNLNIDIKNSYEEKDEYDKEWKNALIQIKYHLIENDYYSLEDFTKIPPTLLSDEVILKHYLKLQGITVELGDEDGIKYYERIKEYIMAILNPHLTVSSVKKFNELLSLEQWERDLEINGNRNYFISCDQLCDILEKTKFVFSAIEFLKEFMRDNDLFDDKKYALIKACMEYHQIYHYPDFKDKSQALRNKKNIISGYLISLNNKKKKNYISSKSEEFRFKNAFGVRISEPIVMRKVAEVKQRNTIKKLYEEKDKHLMEQLAKFKNKYLNAFYEKLKIAKIELSDIIDLFITHSINNEQIDFDKILFYKKPKRFDEYETYKRVLNLIKKLNSSSISCESQEFELYKNLIHFDGEKYIYVGEKFSLEEINEIKIYKELRRIYQQINNEIIQLAEDMISADDLTEKDYNNAFSNFPFNDEFFEYDFNNLCVKNRQARYIDIDGSIISVLNRILEVFKNNKNLILNDYLYENIKHLTIEEGLLQIYFITKTFDVYFGDNMISKAFTYDGIVHLIKNFENIAIMMLGEKKIGIENFIEIFDKIKYGDIKTITIIGEQTISNMPNRTHEISEKNKNYFCDILIFNASRNISTVPNFSSKMKDSWGYDIHYSVVGGYTDEMLNEISKEQDITEFIKICSQNKNSFTISIDDKSGESICCVHAYRNGNGIYINDVIILNGGTGGYYYAQLLKDVCDRIVHNNQFEGIDFIVAPEKLKIYESLSYEQETNCYRTISSKTCKALYTYYDSTDESDMLLAKHGNYYLISGEEKDNHKGVVCLASKNGELTSDKIKKGDVGAVYTRKRKRISIDNLSDDIINHINKVRACYAHLNNTNFEYFNQFYDCKVINGDNWYIILGSEGVIDSCYLSSDTHAIREFGFIIEQIKNEQEISLEFEERGQERK